jgi:hypothetical protein
MSIMAAMSTSFGACPQCAGRMRIERLHCWRCGTSVTGRIPIPILALLPPEQAHFVETFVQSNGSLTKVQEVLGCSYPKVRRLLNESMASLKAELEADVREKEEILAALEGDRLEGTEAMQLLRSLAGGKRDEE